MFIAVYFVFRLLQISLTLRIRLKGQNTSSAVECKQGHLQSKFTVKNVVFCNPTWGPP